jgi:predicted O-methyltransferase YrrM
MIISYIRKFPLLKSKLKTLLGFTSIVFAKVKLKKAVAKCKSWKELINLTYTFQFNIYKNKFFRFGILPLQVKEELIDFLKIFIMQHPKIIFECGTASGGNLFLLTRFSDEDSIIISVDLPGGKFGGGYPSWKIPFYKSFASYNQKIILIRDDSHKISTLESLKEVLNNRKIDVAYIDGDHTYSGVKRDFEMYKDLIKPEGLIVFHDIVPHKNKSVGVPKFWQEIHKGYEFKEIVKDWNQNGSGIGILVMK